MAKVLVVRKGGGESCNCKLLKVADTDNHMVLVDAILTHPTLAANEATSVTAEFTPRVRLDRSDAKSGAVRQEILREVNSVGARVYSPKERVIETKKQSASVARKAVKELAVAKTPNASDRSRPRRVPNQQPGKARCRSQ